MSESRWSATTRMAGERVCFVFALLLVACSVAVVPALITEKSTEAETEPFWFWCTVGVIGWFVSYWAVWSFLARRRVLATISLIATFSLSVFLRFLLYEVNRFSGYGFSDQ